MFIFSYTLFHPEGDVMTTSNRNGPLLTPLQLYDEIRRHCDEAGLQHWQIVMNGCPQESRHEIASCLSNLLLLTLGK